MPEKSGMIEAVAPTSSVRRAYDLYSRFYGALVAPLERQQRALALERACVQPDDRVLEVAPGPGEGLLEVLKRVGPSNSVAAVDLSRRMLSTTKHLVRAAGYGNLLLQEADARRLPYRDARFDVLLNSYMLDLIPLGDMAAVLGEFRRVLKPGGRLVLVNMSKPRAETCTMYERAYNLLPKRWVPYLMGSCRPVLMEDPVRGAGFGDVQREYLGHLMPSEIITARAA